MALLMAANRHVLPSPVAPKVRTSKSMGESAGACGLLGCSQRGDGGDGGGGKTHAAESQKIAAGGIKGFHGGASS